MSRSDRVAQRIKVLISEILHCEINDPRIGFLTVTDVSVSPDLKNAKIYVSVLGKENDKKEALKGLESARKFIRGCLGNKLSLRAVPEISFHHDESLEKASKLWNLMREQQK
ncbi:MAG: 30S ribosome-binding factor RbfA [Candidatus Saganbacteria bacterium]|nr:30S ribosome-binding factor RbfA [Candidatus Saganbacteria bacterium]